MSKYQIILDIDPQATEAEARNTLAMALSIGNVNSGDLVDVSNELCEGCGDLVATVLLDANGYCEECRP